MGFRMISAREAADLLAAASTDAVLLDCREPEERALARLPGSLDIPMRELPARVGELDRSKDILVLCHHGIRSTQVAVYLARLGFPRVASVEGGIEAWSSEVDPSVPLY